MRHFAISLLLLSSITAAAQVTTRVNITSELPGRTAVYLDRPSYYTDEGVVVVKIAVDNKGEVVKADVDETKTNTDNSSLKRQSRISAELSTFSKTEAQDTLWGSITYRYSRLNQYQLDSLQTEKIVELERYIKNQQLCPEYELYATDNMWTFIELDTVTGAVYQVQYSTQGPDYRFRTSISYEDLRDSSYEHKDRRIPGRFKLYKTQNMYIFILLDSVDGRTWQVQWSTDKKERCIIRIR